MSETCPRCELTNEPVTGEFCELCKPENRVDELAALSARLGLKTDADERFAWQSFSPDNGGYYTIVGKYAADIDTLLSALAASEGKLKDAERDRDRANEREANIRAGYDEIGGIAQRLTEIVMRGALRREGDRPGPSVTEPWDPRWDNHLSGTGLERSEADLSASPLPADAPFPLGKRVRKTKGSSWQGAVCGFYSTVLTPRGVCVESEREPGSVQIYPASGLEAVPDDLTTSGFGHE